jgi:hypothetical protein
VVWEADVCADATKLTISDTVARTPALIFFIMFPCAGLIGRWQMIFHQGSESRRQSDNGCIGIYHSPRIEANQRAHPVLPQEIPHDSVAPHLHLTTIDEMRLQDCEQELEMLVNASQETPWNLSIYVAPMPKESLAAALGGMPEGLLRGADG